VTRLAALGVKPVPTVVVVKRVGEPMARAARNVPWLTLEKPTRVSVYQLMTARQVVFERDALLELEEALRA
jgi:ribosomal protein L4